ncbi:hypothetical protein Tco_1368796 [Tanacetum coccineum]
MLPKFLLHGEMCKDKCVTALGEIYKDKCVTALGEMCKEKCVTALGEMCKEKCVTTLGEICKEKFDDSSVIHHPGGRNMYIRYLVDSLCYRFDVTVLTT